MTLHGGMFVYAPRCSTNIHSPEFYGTLSDFIVSGKDQFFKTIGEYKANFPVRHYFMKNLRKSYDLERMIRDLGSAMSEEAFLSRLGPVRPIFPEANRDEMEKMAATMFATTKDALAVLLKAVVEGGSKYGTLADDVMVVRDDTQYHKITRTGRIFIDARASGRAELKAYWTTGVDEPTIVTYNDQYGEAGWVTWYERVMGDLHLKSERPWERVVDDWIDRKAEDAHVTESQTDSCPKSEI